MQALKYRYGSDLFATLSDAICNFLYKPREVYSERNENLFSFFFTRRLNLSGTGSKWVFREQMGE